MNPCPQCGTPFAQTASGDKKYCSESCQIKAATARRASKRLNAKTARPCVICGTMLPVTSRKDQKICSPKCQHEFRRQKREAKKPKVAPIKPAPIKPAPSTAESKQVPLADAARILNPNFYLGDLRAELESVRNSKSARREIESALRASLIGGVLWPSEPAGRAALVLWLLDNEWPSIRFQHRHNRPPKPRVIR
jgi:predicted nucleic acid-binding Zn ribbon protein